jgi:DNA-binding FadR family transcriptional regulator
MTSVRRPARSRTSRTDEVQQRIKALILERGLVAGDPMPTEYELMEQLDVGRNSLREALKALQTIGIVQTRHGFGTYVSHRSLDALIDGLTFHGRMSLQAEHNDLVHLVQIREALECGLIGQVIALAPDESLPPLREVIAQMETEVAAGLVSPETDRHFHELLYTPLDNPIVSQLLGAFWEVHHVLQHELRPIQEPAHNTVDQHRAICDAVQARDTAAAVAAMAAHFAGIRTRLASKP